MQAWAAELADSEKGGMVNGFPSRITTVAELVDLVSTIIMQVSAVHYSLNYRQYVPPAQPPLPPPYPL